MIIRLKGLSGKRTGRLYFIVQTVNDNPKIHTTKIKEMTLDFYRKYVPNLTPRTIERDIKYAKEEGFLIIKKRRCKVNLEKCEAILFPIGKPEKWLTDRFISSREIILSKAGRYISPSDLWRKVMEDYRKIATMKRIGRKTMAMNRTFDILKEKYPSIIGFSQNFINENAIRRQFYRDIKKLKDSGRLVFNKNGKCKENQYFTDEVLLERPLTKKERDREIIEQIKMFELEEDIKKYGYEKVREMKKWKGRIL